MVVTTGEVGISRDAICGGKSEPSQTTLPVRAVKQINAPVRRARNNVKEEKQAGCTLMRPSRALGSLDSVSSRRRKIPIAKKRV